MTSAKKLGICMDHSTARVMEYSTGPVDIKNLPPEFRNNERDDSLLASEYLMHSKEQQQQGVYYKDLGEVIGKYDEVLLFGPTSAKTELLNLLKADKHFDHIAIEVMQTDKLTENQQHAFVRDYFEGR